MNQIEVKVIQLQSPEGVFKGFHCACITISLNPKLCGNKQLFSFNATSFHSSTNRLFVHIRGSRINVPISNVNSVNHASFTFGQISYLKNTETKNGDFNAIVQFYCLHKSLLIWLSTESLSLCARGRLRFFQL